MTRAALRPVLWKRGPLRRLNGTLAGAGPEQAGKYVSACLKMIKEKKKKVFSSSRLRLVSDKQTAAPVPVCFQKAQPTVMHVMD